MENTILYIFNVEKLYDEQEFCSIYSILDRNSQEKIDTLKQKKDKVLSLAGAILLKYALKENNINNFDYNYNENNKPYLKDVFFNKSHSGNYVICALSDSEIGIDIEKIENFNIKIAKRFFTKNEYEFINSKQTDKEKEDVFFRLWTLKESFVKATGTGLSFPLNKFEINIENGITINQNYDNKKYYFSEISDIPNYKISICIQNCNEKVFVKFVDYNLLKV